MKKYLFILPLVLVAWTPLSGQSNPNVRPTSRHEFTFYAGGGLSTLHYQSSIGSYTNLPGGLFGADYRIYFSKWAGFGAGLELSFYNAKGVIRECAYTMQEKDIEGTDFEFRTNLNNYGERERITTLNIPLMFRFRGDPEKHRPYAALGAKISIPLSGKYRIVEGNSFNSGYYAEEDYEYTTQRFMGFRPFPDLDDRDLQLRPACLLSVEAGMNWRLQYVLLYTGFYADYGLTGVVKKSDQLIASYDHDKTSEYYTRSMLSSQYMLADARPEPITAKVLPVAVGFKIGVTLGHGRKREKFVAYDQAPVFNHRR